MQSDISRILDKDTEDGPEKIENPFGWVLFLEMLIFLTHFFLCYKNSIKYKERYEKRKNEGTLFKYRFTRTMGLGSLARGISLILMLWIHSPNESTGILALEYLFITLPCLLWMPSYFSVIIFFVKINYLITGKNETIVQPFLRALFWCSIAIYCWFFLHAIAGGDYDDFVYDSSWLVGLLYIVLSIGIFLFGQKIIWHMKHADNEEHVHKIAQSLKSVEILTYLSAAVFIIRGIFSILTVMDGDVTRKYLVETLHIWHSLLFLVSELAPALAITYLTKEKPEKQATHEDFELSVFLKNSQNAREKPLLADV